MKYFNKVMGFFVFMFLSYGADTFAFFEHKIANQTGRDVKVELHSKYGMQKNGYGLIESRGDKRFTVSSCLNQIKISTETSGRCKEVKVKNFSGKSISISSGECRSRAFILKIDKVSGEIVALML